MKSVRVLRIIEDRTKTPTHFEIRIALLSDRD
jgi:hypothetical protein